MALPTWVAAGARALLPAGVALFIVVVTLAAVEAGRTLWRWWQHQPEPDVGLRVRGAAYLALACILVGAFFLSRPVAGLGTFRVQMPIWAWVSATVAYGTYALWSLLLPRLRRVVPPRIRRGLDVLGMNAVLALVLAEVALRVGGTFWPSPLLMAPSAPPQVRRGANRGPPGQIRFNFPLNQGGHYDSEFKPASAVPGPVVVSIGDSYSYGTVPHAFHFTTVAEQEIPGVEIYNMGYPQIGPSDYLYLLEHEALPLDPDLVVVNLFLGNDVTDGPGMPMGPPRWYDADSYMVAVVWRRWQIMRRARLAHRAEVTADPNLTRGELAVVYPWLADPFLEKPSFSREVFLEIEARNARGICTPDAGHERFFQTLADMERVAERAHVPLALVLIPEEFQVEDDLWEEITRKSVGPRLDRDRPQRMVVEWMERRGGAVLDLLPILRAVPPLKDGRRHLYHLQDSHFNARGNEVAGRAIARFVASLLSTEPAPPGHKASQTVAESRPPAVSLPLHVDIGDSSARGWMHSGWQVDETAGGASYAWSDGMRSVLTIPLPTGTDIRMDFEALPFAFSRSPQQRVSVILNGTVIEEVPLRPGLQKYSVILPADVVLGAPDTLEFRYAYARAPQDVLRLSSDSRMLAVAWYSVDFFRIGTDERQPKPRGIGARPSVAPKLRGGMARPPV
ncbi:MAG: hypothetical protein HY599_03735 [Candidatus Omnitrophica bacterium]|nr:hypothetical protein [Candidatus Omnitrophota bacterium]